MVFRTLVAGILGFVVLAVWTFTVNSVFFFTARMEMNRVLDEPAVHRVLTTNVPAPGAYLVNPRLTADGRFPGGEPVFGVTYSGMGHEAAGPMMLVNMVLGLVSAWLVAGLLAAASPRVLGTWPGRIGLVTAVSALIALTGDVSRVGIGGYPVGTAVPIALVRLGGWTLAGVAMAWVTSLHGHQGRTGPDPVVEDVGPEKVQRR